MVIENINIRYGENIILKPSTLSVSSTGVTSLLGRNGTGKTSIMNSIYGLNDAKDIIISFDGVVMKRPYVNAGLLNYIGQKKCHPDFLTINRVLNEYSITSSVFYNKYPIFMSDQWSRLDELSYGFRRLFIILVAIEADVRYTILDEPFSSIMPVHNELIISAIRSASDRKGLLISDHQFRTLLSVTDKLYLIFDQHVKLLNSHSELIDYGYLSKGTSL